MVVMFEFYKQLNIFDQENRKLKEYGNYRLTQ